MQHKPKHCLQHHDRTVHSRGRCKPCYESIKRMIRDGELTDARAVKEGWLLPKRKENASRRCLNHKKAKVYSRGLCFKCYRHVRNLIKMGKITEEKAIARKMILMSSRDY